MVLEDVCELIADCPHTTAPDEGKGYPLIRTPNVGKGRLLLEGVHRVSKDIYDKRNMRCIVRECFLELYKISRWFGLFKSCIGIPI